MGALIEKFGNLGKKGEEGEQFILSVLQTDGYTVTDYRKDLIVQAQGIDFGISGKGLRREFTIDVKNNLYIPKNGIYAFKVEIERSNRAGWLYTSKADYIYHTNTYTGNYVRYNLNELRYYITKQLINQSVSDVFKVVRHNGDLLIQFEFTRNIAHNVPVSNLF